MKIEEVKVIVTCPGRNYVLVKIVTGKGIYGVGEATLNGRELAVAKVLQEYIGPYLIGKDPNNIEDIWQELFRGTYWRDGPVLMTALSGVDMALWDIKGKIANLPVYSLLGGKTRNKVRTYLHCSGESFEETLKNCKKAMENGCTALRVTTGTPGYLGAEASAEDMKKLMKSEKITKLWEPAPYMQMLPKLLKYLRQELGEEIDLIIDVHSRLNPIQACKLVKDIENYKLFFIEDPIRPEFKDGLRLLRSHTTVPIAVGEHYFTKWNCLSLISEHLIDFLRIDVSHAGGITESKKMAAIAEAYSIDMAFHGPLDMSPIGHAANVHLDMSIPNFGIQEWVFHDPKVHEVFRGGPEYHSGYLTVPDEPGLGVDIDEKAAKKYKYKRGYLPTLRREDGSVWEW